MKSPGAKVSLADAWDSLTIKKVQITGDVGGDFRS